ncbi:hypothetical protein [Uliginosibacterium sediminicola]|uniref:Transposase n=1 Tax=Uliginosibacterium sediminicola TaxID=2024550 RepID=A0ABU9YT18_9RHOO
MKTKAPPARNLLHLAMLRKARNAVHGKSLKRERVNARIALRRSLKDEGVSAQCAAAAY